jgi:hypothetical protein
MVYEVQGYNAKLIIGYDGAKNKNSNDGPIKKMIIKTMSSLL